MYVSHATKKLNFMAAIQDQKINSNRIVEVLLNFQSTTFFFRQFIGISIEGIGFIKFPLNVYLFKLLS